MAKRVQRRRGTSAEHGSFTGAPGEITIDTTTNRVVTHDGSTAGGHEHVLLSDTASNANDGVATSQQITELEALRSSSGGSAADTNMGTYSGSILSDNTNQQALNQELETDLEALQTATGIPAESTNMGTYTGSIISDNVNQKTVNQELETDLQALQTASGIAAESTDMGTYTGDILTDSTTQRALNQEIEDELISARSHRVGRQGGYSFDIITDKLEGSGPILDGVSAWTASVDFKVDDQLGNHMLISEAAGSNPRWYLALTGTDIIFRIADGTADLSITVTQPSNFVGVRHNLTGTNDGSNQYLYLDGKLIASSSTTIVSFTPNDITRIGNYGVNTWGMTGDIYSARIWSAAKTAAEALAISQGYNDTTNLELHLSGDTVSSGDTVWADLSGNDRNAVSVGATAIASAIAETHVSESEYTTYRKLDGGYYLSAATHVLPTHVDLAGSPTATFLATFKHDNIGSFDFLFSDYNSDPNRSFYIGLNSANKIQYFWYNGYAANYNSATSELVLNDGETYVLAIVRNSVSDTDVYLNGEKIPMTALTAGTGGSTNFASTTADGISIGNSETLGNHWDGDIYEARIFNYALSDADVKSYSRGAATKYLDNINPWEINNELGINNSQAGITITSDSISGTNSSGGTAFVNVLSSSDDHPDPQIVNYNDGFIVRRHGSSYRVQFDYTGTVSSGCTVSDGSGGALNIGGSSGSFDEVFTLTPDADRIYFRIPDTDSCNVNNVVVTPLGEHAHYAPEGATTSVWEDCSGLSNHAVVNGAELLKPQLQETYTTNQELTTYRKFDGGYQLGTSGNQNIATPDILLDSDFSILLTTDLKTSSSATRWLASSDNGGTSSRQFEIYQTTAGLLTVQIGGSNYISANGSPGIDGPAVIAVILDESAASFTCYINGKVFPLTETVNTFTAMGSTALPIKFGDPTRASGEMDGAIYEARIFNYALSDADVKAYSRGAATAPGETGELAHYTPTSSTTNIWEDTSGLDNHAVVDGAELLTPQLQETYATNQELVSSRVGRGPAYYFDGTNDSIGDIDEAAINSNDFTWAVDINPADDAANYGVIYGLGSGAFTNRRYLRYNAGKYDVTIGDSSATVIEAEWPAQKANVIVTHDSTTSTIKLYIDGKLIKEKVHTNQFDVATSPMSNNVMDIGSLGSGTYFKGEISKVAIYNRALTAAEVELVSRGQSLGYADEGADGTAIETSVFSAGVDSYVQVNGTADGNIDSIGGEDDTLRFTLNGTSNVHGVYKNVGSVYGKRYRLTGKYYISSTNSDATGLAFYFGASSRTLIHSTGGAAATDTWVEVDAEVICGQDYAAITNPERLSIYALNSSLATVFTDSGSDDVFYLKDIVITQLGEVLKFLPESAASAKWYNEGGAGSSADGTVTGATLINERKRGVFDNLYLDNVPSSDAGLIAGEIYRDNNGHLKIKL